MSNSRLYSTNLDNYTLSASNADTSYPIENLKDYDTGTEFRSSDTTVPFYLTVNFGETRVVNSLVIDGSNFGTLTSNLTIYLESSSNGTTYSSGRVVSPANDTPYSLVFSDSSAQFWRLRFDTGTMLEEVRIGNLFLDNYLEWDTPYEYEYISNDNEHSTFSGASLSGKMRTVQLYAARNQFEVRYNIQSDTIRDKFRTFFQNIQGKARPFYYEDTDGVITYCQLDSDYQPVIGKAYGKTNIETLKIRTKDVT